MALMDMGNGLWYDSLNGKTVIKDDTGTPVYTYDPQHPGGGATTYGGQTYTGRYNPIALGAITPDALSSAYSQYLPNAQQSQDTYWKTHGIDSTGTGDQSQTVLDQLAFNKSASQAQKSLSPQDQNFFDTLKQMSSQRTQQTQQQAPQTPQPTPAMPEQPTPKADVRASAVQPDVQQTSQQPDTSASTPATPPDYTGFLNTMYSQIQPYLASLSTPASGTIPQSQSSAFNIGTKAPTISSNNASPDFSMGGYNPQTSYSSPDTGASAGKGASPSSSSASKGMATGQFGSK